MTRADKIVFTAVAVIAAIVVLLILFGCSSPKIEFPDTKLDFGNVLTLVVVFTIGVVMLTVGLAELRLYFWPSWRVGYRCDKPSFFSGVAWLVIGVICIGTSVAMICVGGAQ